jgi:hypothetical protein
MALPTGLSVRVKSMTVDFDDSGVATAVAVQHALVDDGGNVLGGGARRYVADGPTVRDSFLGDGKTTVFTTTQASYGGTLLSVQLNGVAQTSGFATASNADDTISVTFSTAPAGPNPAATPPTPAVEVALAYSTGPGLWNAAGDLTKTLGLTSGQGMVFAGSSAASAHKMAADTAGLLRQWAAARLAADLG